MKTTKIILVLIAIFSLTACNTVSGLGDDLKKASEWTRDKLPK
ncbi:entericidin [Polynucleobacter sp. MWH-Spelu-300-X4]|jgi:predicted small secreted protein|nr:entericidin [Polynucleobacter sp. MWH-Spelu-300-X4]QWD80332.1 entericidin [Polynucleobacter sp. MWH-Spelu-300-X4]